MANSNSVGLALATEVTYGTCPASADMKEIRFTAESLAKTTGSTTSAEIRSDRQITDVVRVSAGADGSINGELSYAALTTTSSAQDILLEAALMSANWSAIQTNSGTYSCTSGGTTITGTGVGTGITAGQWVRFKDGTTLIGYFLVTVASANTLTVAQTMPSTVTGGGNEEIEAGAAIKNGTTERSFSIERSHADLSNTFELYTGMKVNSFSLNVAAGSISRISFGMVGQDEESKAATSGDGSVTAHVANAVMNGVDNVYAVREGHVSLGTIVRAFSMQVLNNHYGREAVGQLGPISMGSGTCTVTGTLTIYFENNSLIDDFRNWVTTNLTFIMQDSAGNAYCFAIPECKLTLGRASTPGLNQDVTAELSFQAFRDATLNETIRITRWDA